MTSRDSRIAREARLQVFASMFTAFAALVSVLMLATPASAATRCRVSATSMAPSQLKLVQLSVQGVGCATADRVARQVGADLGAGKPLALSGVSGIDVATTTSCANCASKTQVAVTYPKGTISISFTGKTKVASLEPSLAPTIPFPQIPSIAFPHIPGFPQMPAISFPDIPGFTFPTVPGFPLEGSGGVVTV